MRCLFSNHRAFIRVAKRCGADHAAFIGITAVDLLIQALEDSQQFIARFDRGLGTGCLIHLNCSQE